MLLSRQYRFVMLHIPKTAGTSIHDTLAKKCRDALDRPTRVPRIADFPDKYVWNDVWHHPLARDVKCAMGAAKWDESFSFAFVRNPWARQVSWFNMIREREGILKQKAKDFGEFLERPDDGPGPSPGHPVHERRRNQVEYLMDEDGEQIVDFVGRFENLEEDFAEVCRRIGVDASLPSEKYNASTPCDYHDFYTPSLRDLIAERFADDIAAFGYEF
jgi:hypothetical protein